MFLKLSNDWIEKKICWNKYFINSDMWSQFTSTQLSLAIWDYVPDSLSIKKKKIG